MKKDAQAVSFITIEDEPPDLILSFAIWQTAMELVKSGDDKSSKGDLDGAIADYSKAIELNPNDAEVYNSRGIAKCSDS